METERKIAEKEREVLELKAYLASKDYQTIREMQGGEPMSAEIKAKCAEARARINALEAEVEALREMKEDVESIEAEYEG